MEPNAAIALSELMNQNTVDIEISYREWSSALCATQSGYINQLLSAILTAIEQGGKAVVLDADELTPCYIVRDRIDFDRLICQVNRSRAAPEFAPLDHSPLMAPCSKCGERENIDGELHPGTAYIACGRCGHKGPAFAPRVGMSKADERKLFTAAVGAWNEESRQVDQ